MGELFIFIREFTRAHRKFLRVFSPKIVLRNCNLTKNRNMNIYKSMKVSKKKVSKVSKNMQSIKKVSKNKQKSFRIFSEVFDPDFVCVLHHIGLNIHLKKRTVITFSILFQFVS